MKSQIRQSVHGSAPRRSPPIPAARHLIREYLARTVAPPAIFKPSFQAFSPPPALELAYKHPRLLFEQEDEPEMERLSSSPKINSFLEQNRELTVQYVDDNSIEMLDATKETLIQPRTFSVKRTAFEKPTEEVLPHCKLVGKVTPNLIKTWEQLNAGNQPNPLPALSTNSQGPHQLQSEDFYDSIDDDQLVSELERIPSMCDEYHDLLDDDVNGMDEVLFDGRMLGRQAAGEVMAQFESIDKRKICWSMDSDKVLN